MTKKLKSDLRKVIFTMINKFKEKQVERDVIFKQKQEYLREISQCIDVSVGTLKRIKKEGQINEGVWNTPGKKRPHKPTVSALDNFDIDAIKNKINEFYIVKKQIPTLRSLLSELRESINFTGCRETLRRILLSNGFEFKKNKDERSILIERYDIAAWRHRFLRTIDAKRREGKEIVYLDETYVHQNYKSKKSWQGPSTSGAVTNISSGKRYIIVHAGSQKGFVPNALLVFSTKSKNADYHHDMNSQNFNKWISEKLIPNLSVPSVIVMDNASYHCVQINKGPTTNTRKSEIQAWLSSNGAMARLIEDSFNSVTPEDWKKNTDHIIHVEEQYKKRDGITADMEQFIIGSFSKKWHRLN
ncbi:hypothetical protein ABMA27_010176 [Loxostege sticticalis]|uniref:Tc1-like transposase DDE domain-containing protein n=1 Tax=Loxostege sticticalis TaxID=481309 RepID=A0ABR3H4W1_LOXSC